MLYRMDLLCVDEAIFSVVNIRINLFRHAMTKRQRKLLRRNHRKYRVETGPVVVTERKEALYQHQKARFKGFVHNTLDEYLSSGVADQVFDTREMRVFCGSELVAVSYFDVAGTSMASLLGLFDPAFAGDSLGTFTLLKEMEWGQKEGKKWHYPGYVLDRPSPFDYKLRLGDIEY